MHIQIIIAFSVYILILLFASYWFSQKSKSSSEFILGGRTTNYLVTAVALLASDASHWLFLALPALIYTAGLLRIWELVGIVLFMYLNWQFVAPKLRRQTAKLKAITLFSYFEKRFNDTSGILRITSAIICLLFFSIFISSGLVALGRVLQYTFGLEYHIGILISLFTILFYTLLGGFKGVAWCDFFQGIFAFSMLLLIPLLAYVQNGGWSAIATAAKSKSVNLSILPPMEQWYKLPLLILLWGPGYFGQPQLLSFFMGIKNPKNIKYAKYISLCWQIIGFSASVFIGLLGLIYFSTTGSNGEMIFITMTKSIFSFSPFIIGLTLCAILAATLTTLDSQILTAGSILSEDIYKKITKKEASQNSIVWISRVGSSIVAIMAFFLSINNSNSIYSIIHYAWDGIGSAFGPLVLTSLYAKNINKYGAFAGIITGAITASVWPFLKSPIFPIIPGFLLSLIAIFLVSYLTKHKTTHKTTSNTTE